MRRRAAAWADGPAWASGRARPNQSSASPPTAQASSVQQRDGRAGAVEEGGRAQQADPGAGRQQLADRAPRLRQQLGRRVTPAMRVAEQEDEQHAEADAGAAEHRREPGHGRADGQRDQRDRGRRGEVAAAGHAESLP